MKANKKDPTDGEEEAQSILKMDLASFDLENVFALPPKHCFISLL